MTPADEAGTPINAALIDDGHKEGKEYELEVQPSTETLAHGGAKHQWKDESGERGLSAEVAEGPDQDLGKCVGQTDHADYSHSH